MTTVFQSYKSLNYPSNSYTPSANAACPCNDFCWACSTRCRPRVWSASACSPKRRRDRLPVLWPQTTNPRRSNREWWSRTWPSKSRSNANLTGGRSPPDRQKLGQRTRTNTQEPVLRIRKEWGTVTGKGFTFLKCLKLHLIFVITSLLALFVHLCSSAPTTMEIRAKSGSSPDSCAPIRLRRSPMDLKGKKSRTFRVWQPLIGPKWGSATLGRLAAKHLNSIQKGGFFCWPSFEFFVDLFLCWKKRFFFFREMLLFFL